MAAILEDSTSGSENVGGDTIAVVTLPTTPTSGNILFLRVEAAADGRLSTDPSGWTKLGGYNVTTGPQICYADYYKVSDGTETSVTITALAFNTVVWWYGEYSGLSGTTETGYVTQQATSPASLVTGTISAVSLVLTFATVTGGGAATSTSGFTEIFTQSVANCDQHIGQDSQSSGTLTSGITLGTRDTGISIITWAEVPGATITSVGGDDVVLDAETPAFVTSGFSSEISTVQLVSGTSTTNGSSVSSTSGTGTFSLPDITLYTGDVVGCPLTTANNVVVARLTDA